MQARYTANCVESGRFYTEEVSETYLKHFSVLFLRTGEHTLHVGIAVYETLFRAGLCWLYLLLFKQTLLILLLGREIWQVVGILEESSGFSLEIGQLCVIL